ncbi:MAG: OmpA family protein [bacterium]|nr:OmpA family protein [bacterium]
MKKTAVILSFLFIIGVGCAAVCAGETGKVFQWWPTDAKPGPVKDEERGGYWWWPEYPGQIRPYGNRGFIYVNKIIPGSEGEPAIVIKKILKNVKVYFDTDKSEIRNDAIPILETGINLLRRNPQSTILITGNCDARGKEAYNMLLGEKRGEAVKNYMMQNGIPEERIRIISKGKLNAVAPVGDIEGMQKDRNAQFMVADIVEVPMAEWTKGTVKDVKEIAPEVKVKVKEYTVQKGDTLWKISEKVYGDPARWTRIFDANKSRLKGPNDLKVGQVLEIPLN